MLGIVFRFSPIGKACIPDATKISVLRSIDHHLETWIVHLHRNSQTHRNPLPTLNQKLARAPGTIGKSLRALIGPSEPWKGTGYYSKLGDLLTAPYPNTPNKTSSKYLGGTNSSECQDQRSYQKMFLLIECLKVRGHGVRLAWRVFYRGPLICI